MIKPYNHIPPLFNQPILMRNTLLADQEIKPIEMELYKYLSGKKGQG